jgi:hypothetical protein
VGGERGEGVISDSNPGSGPTLYTKNAAKLLLFNNTRAFNLLVPYILNQTKLLQQQDRIFERMKTIIGCSQKEQKKSKAQTTKILMSREKRG